MLHFLQDAEKRAEFILKLKFEGKDSPNFRALSNIVESMRMNKPPRGIGQKDIIQNILKFTDRGINSFHNIRLVCKDWKLAVETQRVNYFNNTRTLDSLIYYLCNQRISQKPFPPNPFPPIYGKYLQIFKNFNINIGIIVGRRWGDLQSLILNNTKNLKICLIQVSQRFEVPEKFIFDLYGKHKKTLEVINLLRNRIPNFILPKLKYVCFNLDKNMDGNTFENLIQNMLEKFPNIERIRILNPNYKYSTSVIEKMKTKFRKHCVGPFGHQFLKVLPAAIGSIEVLDQELPFLDQLEHLTIHIPLKIGILNNNGWNDYKRFFNLCSNLKEVRLIVGCSLSEMPIRDTEYKHCS